MEYQRSQKFVGLGQRPQSSKETAGSRKGPGERGAFMQAVVTTSPRVKASAAVLQAVVGTSVLSCLPSPGPTKHAMAIRVAVEAAVLLPGRYAS